MDYDTARNSGAIRGTFSADRIFASLGATGDYKFQALAVKFISQLIWIREDQDRYVESNGTAVAGETLDFTRLSVGTKIGYPTSYGIPYVKVAAEWDIENAGAIQTAAGNSSRFDRYGGVLNLGYEVNSGGLTASVEAGTNSVFRDNLDIWVGTLRVRYSF